MSAERSRTGRGSTWCSRRGRRGFQAAGAGLRQSVDRPGTEWIGRTGSSAWFGNGIGRCFVSRGRLLPRRGVCYTAPARTRAGPIARNSLPATGFVSSTTMVNLTPDYSLLAIVVILIATYFVVRWYRSRRSTEFWWPGKRRSATRITVTRSPWRNSTKKPPGWRRRFRRRNGKRHRSVSASAAKLHPPERGGSDDAGEGGIARPAKRKSRSPAKPRKAGSGSGANRRLSPTMPQKRSWDGKCHGTVAPHPDVVHARHPGAAAGGAGTEVTGRRSGAWLGGALHEIAKPAATAGEQVPAEAHEERTYFGIPGWS